MNIGVGKSSCLDHDQLVPASQDQTTTQRLIISYKHLADSLGSFLESSYNLSQSISMCCPKARLFNVYTSYETLIS